MEKLSAIESDAQSQAWLKQFNLGDRALAKKRPRFTVKIPATLALQERIKWWR